MYKRPAPKFNSTVMFKFTETEHKKINIPFRESLGFLTSGKGTQTDWFNVMFRVACALAISEKEYEQSTVDQIKHVYKICEEIEVRSRVSNHKEWSVTPEEAEWLEAAFDAIEELQRTVQRKVFYDTSLRVGKELKDKYVEGKHWKTPPNTK